MINSIPMLQRLLVISGVIWSLLTPLCIVAQVSPAANAAEIKLQLNKLNVLGSVLYVAAHPDDENTRLISYLAKEKLYRTGYLSLTRGDGGQNLIGNELGPLLGLIRTQELLAARRIDGGEQFFTRANDFGYTKSPEETFTFWNKDSILADMVFVIRSFQPDVIICRFPATGEGGHGQHTASAILAQEAFTAAADAKRFPEQLKQVSVWQVKRLLWNTFSFGATNTTSEDQFKIDVGVYNKLLGRGYSEIAADSRSMHKSQGFGAGKNRGVQWEYFKTIAGDAPVNDLLSGVVAGWGRVAGSSSIQTMVDQLIATYRMEDPAASVDGLVKLYSALQSLPDSYWKMQKIKETEQLICICSGLWMEAYSTKTTLSPGMLLEWKVQAINRGTVPVILKSIRVQQFDSTMNVTLRNNELLTLQRKQLLDPNTPVTQPYWLQQPYTLGEYRIPERSLVLKPENEAAAYAEFNVEIAGKNFVFKRPLVYKSVDPVRGEVYRQLEVAPAITATIDEPTYLFSTAQSRVVKVNLKSGIENAGGTVSLEVPKGWVVTPAGIPFELKSIGDERAVSFTVSPATGAIKAAVDTMTAIVTLNGKKLDRGLLNISYDHIPAITIYPTSSAKLVSVPLVIKGRNIGYLKGAGDLIPEMLQQIGYTVTTLSDEEIANGNLSVYDAIVSGVRAYNTNDRLKFLNDKLLEYVKAGGILLVQYNTSGNDLVMNNFGPYPFKISRERVTDEQAQVTFLQPDAAVLQTPNKITPADFDGWVQERGLYFLTDIDSNYQKIFAMNDKGEQPKDGSLVVCNYGKGRYVYTGLSFFRELPAGVPGAYRLFVNLISK
jgi:LmbE family N-acetylglucosaminyl deacetylase